MVTFCLPLQRGGRAQFSAYDVMNSNPLRTCTCVSVGPLTYTVEGGSSHHKWGKLTRGGFREVGTIMYRSILDCWLMGWVGFHYIISSGEKETSLSLYDRIHPTQVHTNSARTHNVVHSKYSYFLLWHHCQVLLASVIEKFEIPRMSTLTTSICL